MATTVTGCSFVANGLTSIVSGQVPTYSYRQTSHSSDYLGVQMTFMSGTSTCYGAAPTFTPYITNSVAGFSRNCIWNYVGSQSYTALLCTASVTNIPNGPLTITYSNAATGSLSPRAFVATFGPSPVGKTITVTSTATTNAIATSTLSAQPASTVTVTASGTLITRQTTQVITQLTTSTTTATISSCFSSSRPSPSGSSPNPTRTPSSSLSSSRPNSSSVVSSTAATPSATGISPACPAADSTTFSTSAGDFVIECYYDRFDSDFGQASPAPANYAQCMNACAAITNCQAVSFVPNGPCYLKYSIGQPSVNGNIWGARLKVVASSTVSALPPASLLPSSTATGAQPSSTIFCPANDGAIIETNAGPFEVECGIDRSNYDMGGSPVYPAVATYEQCLAACAARTGCRQVTYITGGSCYLKSNIGFPNMKPNNFIGGRLLTGDQVYSTRLSTSTTPTSTVATVTLTTTVSGIVYQCGCAPTNAPNPLNLNQLICPYANGQTYTSSCGANYVIECSSDRYGNDLPGTIPYVYSLNECVKACDNTPGCIDISYNPGTPGPCYMKGVIGPIRQNNNIWGARQVSACTSQKLLAGLHRKRVIRSGQDELEIRQIVKRGPYGPDFTYISSTTTSTATVTRTSTTSTATVTPPRSGASTTTVYTTAVVTTVVSSAVLRTVVTTVTDMTCPATRFF